MRGILSARPDANGTVVVTDMEAGLEHLSRSTTRSSDIMLVVAEPYYKSLETAARVADMAAELGIPKTYVVANKVRTPTQAQAIDAFCERHSLELISSIPYDDRIAEASLIPRPPLDYCPDSQSVSMIKDLVARLEGVD